MPYAQSLIVIENDIRQVLLASAYGWPRPLPSTLRVAVLSEGLVLSDPSGYAMGIVPLDCASGLLSAKEVFLGLVREGGIETAGAVELAWDLATVGEAA